MKFKSIVLAILMCLLLCMSSWANWQYYIVTNLSATTATAVGPYKFQPSQIANVGITDYTSLLTDFTFYVNSGRLFVSGPYTNIVGTEPIKYHPHQGIVQGQDLGTVAWYNAPLAVSYGGTGANTATDARTNLGIGAGSLLPTSVQGDMIYASAVDTWVILSKNTSATRYLSNTGTNNNPAWAQVALATGVSGTLPTANGGTGIATTAIVNALTYAGTISLDPALATTYTTTTVNGTGNATINATSAGTAGQRITIIVTNDATSPKVITFGTNFTSLRTLTGTISIAKSVTFISTGSTWQEVSRSPANSGLIKMFLYNPLGLTFWADGAGNAVTVTQDHDNTNHKNYIRVTSSTATQDGDIVVGFQIPNDFGVFHTNSFSIDVRTSDRTNASATVSMYDGAGSVDAGINAVVVTPSDVNVWETKLDTPTAAYAPADFCHIHIHVVAGDGTPDTFDISRILLYYTEK